MIPYINYEQISIVSFRFYTWGVFLSLAFIISYCWLLRQSKKENINISEINKTVFLIFIGGIIGARFAYIFQFFNYYFHHPLEIFAFWQGGLMFYGGLIGALFVFWLIFHKKEKKKEFLIFADLLVPALSLGIFIVRIGCSLINDHQGSLTSLPWGILWLDGSLRHPVAEYLALNGLIMFIVLQKLYKRLKYSPGQLLILFFFWYALARLVLDFTRVKNGPLADPHYWHLTVSQWISLIILLILVILKRKLFFKKYVKNTSYS